MKRIRFFSGLFWGFIGSIWTAIIFLVGLVLGAGIMSDTRYRVMSSYYPTYTRTRHNYDWTNKDDDDSDE